MGNAKIKFKTKTGSIDVDAIILLPLLRKEFPAVQTNKWSTRDIAKYVKKINTTVLVTYLQAEGIHLPIDLTPQPDEVPFDVDVFEGEEDVSDSSEIDIVAVDQNEKTHQQDSTRSATEKAHTQIENTFKTTDREKEKPTTSFPHPSKLTRDEVAIELLQYNVPYNYATKKHADQALLNCRATGKPTDYDPQQQSVQKYLYQPSTESYNRSNAQNFDDQDKPCLHRRDPTRTALSKDATQQWKDFFTQRQTGQNDHDNPSTDFTNLPQNPTIQKDFFDTPSRRLPEVQTDQTSLIDPSHKNKTTSLLTTTQHLDGFRERRPPNNPCLQEENNSTSHREVRASTSQNVQHGSIPYDPRGMHPPPFYNSQNYQHMNPTNHPPHILYGNPNLPPPFYTPNPFVPYYDSHMKSRIPKSILPEYDEKNPIEWLEKFERIVNSSSDTSAEKCQQLRTMLARGMNLWYENNKDDLTLINDWNYMKSRFEREYAHTDALSNYTTQFFDLVQQPTEKAGKYIEKKIYLKNKAGLNLHDTELITIIKKGMLMELRKQIHKEGVVTIEALKRKATLYEEAAEMETVLRSKSNIEVTKLSENFQKNLNVSTPPNTINAVSTGFEKDDNRRPHDSRRDHYLRDHDQQRFRRDTSLNRSYERDRNHSRDRYSSRNRNFTRDRRDRSSSRNRYPSRDQDQQRNRNRSPGRDRYSSRDRHYSRRDRSYSRDRQPRGDSVNKSRDSRDRHHNSRERNSYRRENRDRSYSKDRSFNRNHRYSTRESSTSRDRYDERNSKTEGNRTRDQTPRRDRQRGRSPNRSKAENQGNE